MEDPNIKNLNFNPLLSPLSLKRIPQNKDLIIEVEIIYKDSPEELPVKLEKIQEDNKDDENQDLPEIKSLQLYRKSSKIKIPKEKIKGTFIEDELKNHDDNYLKIELKAKKNKLVLESILHCFEYIFGTFKFVYNKDNLISYFHAFSICKLHDKRNEVLDKLIFDLSDENVVYFIKVCSTLNDNNLSSYCFWLCRYILLNIDEVVPLSFVGYTYNTIVKIKDGFFNFDKNHISFINQNKRIPSIRANLSFLQTYYRNYQENYLKNLITPNNFFNMGKIVRTKSDDNIVNDYPHYYQIVLENDPTISLFGLRESENSNFIISRNIDDFTKYGFNYVGEVVPNFWGTNFDIYDYGFDPNLYEKSPKSISKPREFLGSIHYETNILGECPRFFNIELMDNGNKIQLENVKPDWNPQLECYCLNFYGRVKKASARNFQLVFSDDNDNIILQHGKSSKNEFNIDFREPVSILQAFAISLVSIGKKRVVS